jgi:hypothetical protein
VCFTHFSSSNTQVYKIRKNHTFGKDKKKMSGRRKPPPPAKLTRRKVKQVQKREESQNDNCWFDGSARLPLGIAQLITQFLILPDWIRLSWTTKAWNVVVKSPGSLIKVDLNFLHLLSPSKLQAFKDWWKFQPAGFYSHLRSVKGHESITVSLIKLHRNAKRLLSLTIQDRFTSEYKRGEAPIEKHQPTLKEIHVPFVSRRLLTPETLGFTVTQVLVRHSRGLVPTQEDTEHGFDVNDGDLAKRAEETKLKKEPWHLQTLYIRNCAGLPNNLWQQLTMCLKTLIVDLRAVGMIWSASFPSEPLVALSKLTVLTPLSDTRFNDVCATLLGFTPNLEDLAVSCNTVLESTLMVMVTDLKRLKNWSVEARCFVVTVPKPKLLSVYQSMEAKKTVLLHQIIPLLQSLTWTLTIAQNLSWIEHSTHLRSLKIQSNSHISASNTMKTWTDLWKTVCTLKNLENFELLNMLHFSFSPLVFMEYLPQLSASLKTLRIDVLYTSTELVE